ncbi:LysE family translocator [Desulfopila sp. IMCC35006]|uniref:LysE family translocator n=1 Tax=Desulfopila sp. IMCC35006 TaxID=2569542 RepID=UPI0010AB7E9F|nr:LysE family transporter [Desulfopila sp. IMCC35006]TKB28189.1 LysE family translocator [Desulfopila sp. IMCC35006]
MDIVHGLLVLAVVHTLAAASPGPDFVFVSQQTLANGKRTGLLCSLGIALGLSVHIAYSAFGLAAVVAHSAELLWWVRIVGGSYLIYLGMKGLRAKASAGQRIEGIQRPQQSTLRTIGAGFLCNALNPKAPIYFLSLFTLVLAPDMPLYQIAIFGLWIMFLQLCWFSFVVFILSIPSVNCRFQRAGHWIDRLLGGAMILLGIKVLMSKTS